MGAQDVVRKMFDDFAAGEIDAVLGALADDIEWIEPEGYFTSPGVTRGRDGVAGVIARYPEVWEEFALEPEEWIEAGDTVVVTGSERGVAKATGREYRGRFANVFRVAGGQVAYLQAYADTALMWKALDGEPPA